MMAALRYRYLGTSYGTSTPVGTTATEMRTSCESAEERRAAQAVAEEPWIVFGRARSRGSAAAPAGCLADAAYQALLGRGAGGAVPIARRLGSRRSPNALHRAGQPRERPVSLPTAGAASLMATRRQRAKQRQPQPPEPAADYEHIGVVLRLRPLLRWERREGFREAVSKYADAALQVDGPQPKLCRCDKAFDGDTGQREFFRDSGVVPLIDS